MKRNHFQTLEILLLVLTLAVYCRPAHAYVDMGTGSYIVQVSIAAVAGALFWIKMCWKGIRARFQRGPSPTMPTPPTLPTQASTVIVPPTDAASKDAE